MKKTKIFLYSIFLICVIPLIYVYIEHANLEKNAYDKALTETKKIKTLGEALVFGGIGLGYAIATVFIFIKPQNPIPYLVIIIGTIAVVILYFLRIYGVPIPGTDIVIVDLSTSTPDVITKIAQQILVVPVTALLILRRT